MLQMSANVSTLDLSYLQSSTVDVIKKQIQNIPKGWFLFRTCSK